MSSNNRERGLQSEELNTPTEKRVLAKKLSKRFQKAMLIEDLLNKKNLLY